MIYYHKFLAFLIVSCCRISCISPCLAVHDFDLNEPSTIDQTVEHHPEHVPQVQQEAQHQGQSTTCKIHQAGCEHWNSLTDEERAKQRYRLYYHNLPTEKKKAKAQRAYQMQTTEQRERWEKTKRERRELKKVQEQKENTTQQGGQQRKTPSYWKSLRTRKREGLPIREYKKSSRYWQDPGNGKRVREMGDQKPGGVS